MLILLTAWLVHNWWKLLIGLLAMIAVIEYNYYYKKPGKRGSGEEEPDKKESDKESPEAEKTDKEDPEAEGSAPDRNT